MILTEDLAWAGPTPRCRRDRDAPQPLPRTLLVYAREGNGMHRSHGLLPVQRDVVGVLAQRCGGRIRSGRCVEDIREDITRSGRLRPLVDDDVRRKTERAAARRRLYAVKVVVPGQIPTKDLVAGRRLAIHGGAGDRRLRQWFSELHDLAAAVLHQPSLARGTEEETFDSPIDAQTIVPVTVRPCRHGAGLGGTAGQDPYRADVRQHPAGVRVTVLESLVAVVDVLRPVRERSTFDRR